jgi:hypothetical protein
MTFILKYSTILKEKNKKMEINKTGERERKSERVR